MFLEGTGLKPPSPWIGYDSARPPLLGSDEIFFTLHEGFEFLCCQKVGLWVPVFLSIEVLEIVGE